MVLCIACPLSGKPVYFSLESLTTVHDYIDSFCCEVYYCVLYFVLFIVVLMCTFFLCKSQKEFLNRKFRVKIDKLITFCASLQVFTANFPPNH